jgi:hypothetical protein
MLLKLLAGYFLCARGAHNTLSKFSKNVTFLVQSNCQGGGEAIAFRRQG